MTSDRNIDPIGASDVQALHAYHDGELGWLARLRFERRLARSPALQRELEALSLLGDLAREADAERPSPDLWDRIALGLPAADAARAEAVGGRGTGPLAWLGAPLAAAAAVGVAVAVLVLGPGSGDTPPAGVVRWVDGGGSNVLVLEDAEASATIIWVLDGPSGDAAKEGGRDVA